MIGLNQIEYIVGIDLGTTNSGVSIAHVNDPLNIITVSTWDDSKKPSKTFFPSILYPKDGNDTPKCGMQRDEAGDLGVYVDNISQYLLDIDDSNEKLGRLMDGLTIKKAMTDYLKYFVHLALKRLRVHDRLIASEHFQEFSNEEFIDEDIKTVCYCLVCPTDRQEFMKDCFIEAGIIEESEAEHRLSFVIRAVAVAHSQLSLDRNETDIQNDQDFCVVDVGNISTGIAKVHAASTESLSTITAISDDITHGSINLGIKFKAYLIENMTDLKLNILLIDRFVQTFSENIKYPDHMDTQTKTSISQNDIAGKLIEFTYDDLNKIVLKPFAENIAELVLKADKTQGQCRIFISENYRIKLNFIENLIARDEERLKHYHFILEGLFLGASPGAVSSKISTYKSQTPFFLNEECRSLFSDKTRPFPKPVIEKATDNINENDAYDFMVGIDFGNSFSGCSYVQLRHRNGKPVDTKEIKTIKQDWYMKPESIKNTKNTLIDNRRQGGNLNNFEKTPTLLMPGKKMKSKYWGEEARLRVKHHKDLNLLKNFKLFLYPKSLENFNGYTGDLQELKKQGQFLNDGNPKNEVDAVKIIADYLKLFKNHVIEYIVSKEMKEKFRFLDRTKLLKKYKIRYVITVPAMWNASARDNMMQAAIEATIIKTNELDQLFMISELEAAALYCEKIVTESFNGLKDDTNDTNFIVCDAGGTTVDLFTFNLQVDEKKMPVVSQIGNGIGDTCGSNSLDLRFKGYLRDFYNNFGVNIDIILLGDIMQNFEYNIKPNFMPSLQDDSCYDINFLGKDPIYSTCKFDSMMTNGNRTLKMKNQDMKENIFDPIAERILALIDDQLNQAKKGNIRIDAILMVGGFSQSRYLQQRIKDQYKGVCYVSAPSDGAAAISLGAVSYALNPRVVTKKTAQNSLSLMVQAPFDKALTDSSEKMKGTNGDLNFKKDRLEYFVKKGQEFEHGRRTLYIKNIHAVYPNAAVIAIFACDSEEDANNKYLTKSHVKILETKIIMPHMVGIDGRLIHFKVSLQIGLTVVRVTIECQDQLINSEVQKITRNQRSSLKIMLMCSLVTGN